MTCLPFLIVEVDLQRLWWNQSNDRLQVRSSLGVSMSQDVLRFAQDERSASAGEDQEMFRSQLGKGHEGCFAPGVFFVFMFVPCSFQIVLVKAAFEPIHEIWHQGYSATDIISTFASWAQTAFVSFAYFFRFLCVLHPFLVFSELRVRVLGGWLSRWMPARISSWSGSKRRSGCNSQKKNILKSSLPCGISKISHWKAINLTPCFRRLA